MDQKKEGWEAKDQGRCLKALGPSGNEGLSLTSTQS